MQSNDKQTESRGLGRNWRVDAFRVKVTPRDWRSPRSTQRTRTRSSRPSSFFLYLTTHLPSSSWRLLTVRPSTGKIFPSAIMVMISSIWLSLTKYFSIPSNISMSRWEEGGGLEAMLLLVASVSCRSISSSASKSKLCAVSNRSAVSRVLCSIIMRWVTVVRQSFTACRRYWCELPALLPSSLNRGASGCEGNEGGGRLSGSDGPNEWVAG